MPLSWEVVMSAAAGEAARRSPAEFVAAELDGLVRFAYGLAGSRAAAEDLVSEALLGAIGRWESIDNPVAYVRRSLVNRYLNERRRLRTARAGVGGEPQPVGDLDAGVVRHLDVAAAIARLRPIERAVILLRYLEDRSVAETARILDRPYGTVQRIAFEALRSLRGQPDLRGYRADRAGSEEK